MNSVRFSPRFPYNRPVSLFELCRALNRRRLESLQDALTSQKWKTFCAIPAILHYNFPFLPGCRDGFAPHGFVRPSFAVDSLHHAGELFMDLRTRTAPPRQSRLLGLYAMGSVGSACFTSASDIDFWLLHEAKSFQGGDWQHLEEKLRAVERWAMESAGLETHFYIHEIGEVQRATFSYDRQHAGEFGAILKEEFLRTCVHVAGFEPAHWGGPDAAIDFGPVPHLSTEQYLSACLTQLEKALEKPFKSALKIALLRRLAAKPAEKLPAEIFWERATLGARPDPYMLLLETLWDHFSAIGDTAAHSFLKNVLYMKMVAEETSPERLRRNKDRLLAARFQAIGQAIDLDRLDGFFLWPFEERIRFSEEITRYLQDSLREISSYIGQTKLDPARVRALTRKVMLRRAAGDVVESLTFSDVPSRGEQVFSCVLDERTDEWLLALQRFSGRPDVAGIEPVRKAKTIVPLLAFGIRNNLLKRSKTEVRIYPSDLAPRRMPEILEAVERLLTGSVSDEALEGASVPQRHLLVLEQPVMKDPESRRASLLTRTSWGLVEPRCFAGAESFPAALRAILALPHAAGGVEFLLDPVSGPDGREVTEAFERDTAEDPAATSVIRDTSVYHLIRRGGVRSASSLEALLLELGREGGRVALAAVPGGEDGEMLKGLFARAAQGPAAIFRFAMEQETGFLVVDRDGSCDGWTVHEADAPYSLMANFRYIRNLLGGNAVEVYAVERRRGVRDTWHFGKIPLDPPAESSSDLHFNLAEDGQVSIRFGSRTIERGAMSEACALVAQLIRAARKVNRYYPPFLTGVTFPPEMSKRISIPEATRVKRELEGRIGKILAAMY